MKSERALVTQMLEVLESTTYNGPKMGKAITAAREYLATEPSGERLHVGDSSFESWYSENPISHERKQAMREAYEAGMNDQLAQPLATIGERAELIAELRDAHDRRFVKSPSPYSRAANMLEADAQPKQVTCQIYGHVVGACVECNTHIEAQQAKSKDAELITAYAKLAEAELRANRAEAQHKSQCRITESALNERAQQAKRVPMTPQEITEMATQEQFLLVCDGLEELTQIVRATEQRHDIPPADKPTVDEPEDLYALALKADNWGQP